jgi:hypothetical protein
VFIASIAYSVLQRISLHTDTADIGESDLPPLVRYSEGLLRYGELALIIAHQCGLAFQLQSIGLAVYWVEEWSAWGTGTGSFFLSVQTFFMAWCMHRNKLCSRTEVEPCFRTSKRKWHPSATSWVTGAENKCRVQGTYKLNLFHCKVL